MQRSLFLSLSLTYSDVIVVRIRVSRFLPKRTVLDQQNVTPDTIVDRRLHTEYERYSRQNNWGPSFCRLGGCFGLRLARFFGEGGW
jgi:hypothetical protein